MMLDITRMDITQMDMTRMRFCDPRHEIRNRFLVRLNLSLTQIKPYLWFDELIEIQEISGVLNTI